jgi:hypothetical protein
LKINAKRDLSNQARKYKEVINDHKCAIEEGEQTFENYREFQKFEGLVYEARIKKMEE